MTHIEQIKISTLNSETNLLFLNCDNESAINYINSLSTPKQFKYKMRYYFTLFYYFIFFILIFNFNIDTTTKNSSEY